MKNFITGFIVALIFVLLVGCGEQVRDRNKKDRQSEQYGLNRTLDVYSYDGKQLRHYEGTFDISAYVQGDNKVKFDLDGKRHIIYGGIIITDEK
jgi:hypothetical protein